MAGNVREQNAIEHGFVTVEGDRITLLDLPRGAHATTHAAKPLPNATLTADEQAERQRILNALDNTGAIAPRLQKPWYQPVTLWKKMRRLGLDASDLCLLTLS
jgi:transcriptional regulator of acetoin/glycerol metabolism